MCFSGSQILRFAPLITGDTSSGSGWINTPWRLPFRELKHGTYLICRRSHTCGFLSTLPLQEKSKWRGKSQVRACLQVLARAREHACAKPCDFFFLKTVLPWKKIFFVVVSCVHKSFRISSTIQRHGRHLAESWALAADQMFHFFPRKSEIPGEFNHRQLNGTSC